MSLSLGDLLGDDDSDVSSVEPAPKPVAKPVATPAPAATATTTGASARNDETRARMERLRQMQREREEREKNTYSALEDLGVSVKRRTPSPEALPRGNVSLKKTPNILDFSDSDSETLGGSKKPPKPAATAAPANERGRGNGRAGTEPRRGGGGARRSRRDGDASDDGSEGTEDSLEEWGVMVADRGTQTTLGTTIETQTDPPARVVNCRECYKKHYGRDVAPEDLVVPCEHALTDLLHPSGGRTADVGVGPGAPAGGLGTFGAHGALAGATGFHADPAVRDFLTDGLAGSRIRGVGDAGGGGAFPSSTAHWKLQLSKIHYMLDRTLTSLAPDLQVAQEVLGVRRGEGAAVPAQVAQVAAEDTTGVATSAAPEATDDTDTDKDATIRNLQSQLAELRAACSTVQRQHTQQVAHHVGHYAAQQAPPPAPAPPQVVAPPDAAAAPPPAPAPAPAPPPPPYASYMYPQSYGYYPQYGYPYAMPAYPHAAYDYSAYAAYAAPAVAGAVPQAAAGVGAVA